MIFASMFLDKFEKAEWKNTNTKFSKGIWVWNFAIHMIFASMFLDKFEKAEWKNINTKFSKLKKIQKIPLY